ncbi:MAG: DUF6754 domain-containing protein [Bacillota bacterium]|jgi:hypothetical protein
MVQGRVGSLVLLAMLTAVMFYARRAFGMTKEMHIRRIPGLDAIDEMVGRVTEMGRPLAFVFGGSELEAQGFASMRILSHVASEVARYDAKMLVVVPLPEMEPMCQEIMRNSYTTSGNAESYNPANVMYMPGDASKAGVLGMYQRERVAGAMLFGNYYYESMLFAEAASLVGALQIGGTANYHQLPFFVASCDYTLIGEEIFAAGTYLSREPSEVGALTAQEAGKVLSVVLIIVGCVMATFGSDAVTNFLSK